MNGIDIAIIVVVSVLFAAAVGYLIYRKLKHKGGCCDCGESCGTCSGGCPHCKAADGAKRDGNNANNN